MKSKRNKRIEGLKGGSTRPCRVGNLWYLTRFLLLEAPLVTLNERPMKQGIHPKYVETKITCGCGNSFTTRSTRPEMKVDICSSCHPFYTGKLKYVDTAGRIEKFKTKFAGTEYGKKK